MKQADPYILLKISVIINRMNVMLEGKTMAKLDQTHLRGAKTAAHKVNPDIAFALDVGIAGDTPGMTEKESLSKMGAGPQIMFEFKNIETPDNHFEYWKTGIFHYAVQDPDVEGLVEKIKAHGGKQRMPVREYYPGKKPYRMVYCEDPFGNLVEIYSHSYELTYNPMVNQVLPREELPAGLKTLKGRHVRGKIIVRMHEA